MSREELTTEKRALLALRRLRFRLAEMERANREPIAIIGLGCRFPGAVDQDAFWALLREGRDAVEEIPSERWDVDAFYDPNPDAPGKMYTRRGGFLREVDRFDAAFFGISPREAMSMDPQQRLFLEVAWEALENAGQAPENLAGTQTGVFMGISSNDYFRLTGTGDSSRLDAHAATGNAFCVTPNRFSYLLGLEGPSIAVDTACSSSLVAVHLSCQSLRNGESDLVLAGGVNLILSPENSIIFSRSRMLSPDGRCKTFDAAADGYVRGEGCGVVVLRRLSDAQARGERVLAVIRGSAVNQDGRSTGLTAPNEGAQELVLRKALESAGVSPEEVDYVEAHGTGTALGDPIEVQALGAVLCRDRGAEHPLVIGSVKTNVGHLESAAGVAGLVKVVLSLGHGAIAPHLHFHEPSPHIAWSELPLLVPTSPLPWPAVAGRRRIAGVSSFGFGGTNAHVIVEEAPVAGESAGGGPERPLHLLALSARSEEALRQLAARYEARLSDADTGSFADACFTAGVGRSHFRHRLAVLAGGAEEARVRLASFLVGEEPAGVVAGQGGVDSLKVAFLFSGQGTAYAGMGRRLYETQPGFRRALERCADLLRPHLDRPLLEVLFGGGGELEETLYAQPALFSLQYALAELWRGWGIEPVAALGHSVGEYAAACVAGVFSLEEGLRLIAARGRLLQATPPGEMVSVQAEASWVEERLAGLEDRVSIAALNGADSVVISGEVAAVEWLLEQWSREEVKVKRLAVSRGFHSPLLDPVLESFAREAAGVPYQAPRLPLVSNVTGDLWPAGEAPEAGYWAEHTRRAVRFAPGVETLRRQGVEAWVEVGPSPVLLGLAGRLLPDGLLAASLREGRDDWDQMLESLGRLYAQGAGVDWAGFDRDYPRRRVALPTYPWERSSYWWNQTASTGPSMVPSWRSVVEAAQRQAEQAPLDLDLRSFPSKYHDLDRLTTVSMILALRDLGVFTMEGERHTVEDLLRICGIAPVYQHLLSRWLKKLVHEGFLREHSGAVFESQEPLPEPSLETLWQETRAAAPDLSDLLEYFERCVRSLTRVLTGQESALETLFPGGSFATAENLYQDWAVARYFNGIGRTVAESLVKGLPAGKRLRVLEIGAGTGGTTAALLPVLPAERTTYDYTDLSNHFLTRARQKFSGYPFLRFGLLDIEKPPCEQGYPTRVYDLVVAANVLHATRNLKETIDNARSLLAPGGVLLLYETTEHPPWFDVTTGLLEGWQRFEDGLRGDNPLLKPERWCAVLEAQGFEESWTGPEPGSPAEILGQHIIIARVPWEGGLPVGLDAAEPSAISAVPLFVADAGELETPSIAAARELIESLKSAAPADRLDWLVTYVRDQIARVLSLPPSVQVDRRQRLTDLGLDSLMAIELRNRLATGLGLESTLPATLMFDYPTIEAIAGYLGAESLGLELAPAQLKASPPPDWEAQARAASAARLQNLSDKDVEELLLQKLESLRGVSR